MEIAIYSKRRQNKEGKPYYIFIARMTKKNGEIVPVRVKFRGDAGTPKPDLCPMNIKFDKANCNMSTKDFVREDTGEVGTSYTLWLTAWSEGSKFVDHSMDDFDM